MLTTEEEGVGLVAGAALAGQRAALLMQAAAWAIASTCFRCSRTAAFPCLVLVTMRGEFAEFNPWQIPWARSRRNVFACADSHLHGLTTTMSTTSSAPPATWPSTGNAPVAVLLSQRLIGRKVWSREEGK